MKPNETVTIVNADGSEHIIYDVEDFPISVHAGTLTPTKQCIILPHWHDAIEILYLCEGTTEYMINGTSISLREGQAVFINSRQIHYAYQESPAFCKFIRILLHPSLLSTHSLIEHNFIWPLQNSLEYLILSDNSSWQKEIIQYILDIYSKKGTPAYELSILGNFSLIWGILFQHTPIKPTISNRNNDNLELLR